MWASNRIGSVVHAEDTGKLWFGGSSAWLELTPGGVGDHDHNDVYYTETEVDNFFYGEAAGKKQIDYSNVANKPATFIPSSHDNTSHSAVYITSSAITFDTLQTNGDIGSGADQLAIGSHNHDTDYSELGHTHTEANITNLDKYTQAQVNTLLTAKADTTHLHDDRYYTETEVDTTLSGYSLTSHDHDEDYEPVITKATGFNLALGTTAGTIAEGNHTHDASYYTETELLATTDSASGADKIGATIVGSGTATTVQGILEEINTTVTSLNLSAATFEALQAIGDVGPGADQVAIGNHLHTGIYEPVITKATGFNLPLGVVEDTIAEGDHLHDDRYYTETEVDTTLSGYSLTSHDHDGDYEPTITKATGFNLPLGVVEDTIAEGDHVHGNISNDGKVGTTSGKPLMTTTDGAVTAGSFGTTSGTVAEGDHLHDDRYYTETEVNTKFSELLVPSTTGTPSDTPPANTVRFNAASGILYIYNGSAWKSVTLT